MRGQAYFEADWRREQLRTNLWLVPIVQTLGIVVLFAFGLAVPALVLAFNIAFRVGFLADYRRPFWRAARHALRRGQIDAVLGMGFAAYHLIEFSREALRGDQNASFYSTLKRERKFESQPLRKSA